MAACKKAIRLKPDYPLAHYTLGIALAQQGKLAEAVAAFKEAIRLKPDDLEAHCNLGFALLQQGKFDESLAAFRRGHELGARKSGGSSLSALWLRRAERLVELDKHLPDLLSGKAKPRNAREQIELAHLCTLKRYFAASARFYAGAFVARPALARDTQAGHRYNAACSAALAACGQGNDPVKPEKERLRLRQKGWKRPTLALRDKQG